MDSNEIDNEIGWHSWKSIYWCLLLKFTKCATLKLVAFHKRTNFGYLFLMGSGNFSTSNTKKCHITVVYNSRSFWLKGKANKSGIDFVNMNPFSVFKSDRLVHCKYESKHFILRLTSVSGIIFFPCTPLQKKNEEKKKGIYSSLKQLYLQTLSLYFVCSGVLGKLKYLCNYMTNDSSFPVSYTRVFYVELKEISVIFSVG